MTVGAQFIAKKFAFELIVQSNVQFTYESIRGGGTFRVEAAIDFIRKLSNRWHVCDQM